MPPKRSSQGLGQKEAPKALVVAAIVVIVLGLGAGGFYAFNGGWKTAGQQEETYKHEFLPIMAAKHGDTTALDEENKLRQQHGQAPLEVPKDRKQIQGDYRQRLQELQQKLAGGQQGRPAGQ